MNARRVAAHVARGKAYIERRAHVRGPEGDAMTALLNRVTFDRDRWKAECATVNAMLADAEMELRRLRVVVADQARLLSESDMRSPSSRSSQSRGVGPEGGERRL